MSLYKLLPRRLDRQVVVIASIVIAVLYPLFVLNEARKEINEVTITATQEMQVIARNIAQSVAESVLVRDFTAVENLLSRAAQFPGIKVIQVIDSRGRVLSDVVMNQGLVESRYSVNRIDPPGETKTVVDRERNLLLVWEPVLKNTDSGWVRISYDLQRAYQRAYDRLSHFLLHVGLLIVAMIVLILVFLRKPMKRLGDAAEFASHLREKSGDQIPVASQSLELEKLTMALNSTASILYQQEETIRRIVKDLEIQKKALDQHSIVLILDEHGYVTYANDKFLEVSGFQRKDVLAKPYDTVQASQAGSRFDDGVWKMVRNGYIWQGETSCINRQGQTVWLYTSIIPVQGDTDKPYQYVKISTDITRKKQVEDELEQKNKILSELTGHLEEIVQTRTSELEQANQELVQLNRVKSNFVSLVSHELRTPLTSVKLFTELLLDDFDDMEPEQRRRYLGIINDEADRLGRLINDVLDLQKIDAGLMQWKDEIVDLNEVIQSSFDLFVPVFKEKSVEFSFNSETEDALVKIDRDRIRQTVNNLLSNASKFCETGTVSVQLTRDETERMYRVSVCDSGLGVPEDEIEKIFKRFHQVDNSETRIQGGSGLGLNICKEVIEHYNGRIWFEHNRPRGSCFIFKVPVAAEVSISSVAEAKQLQK